MDRIKRLWHLMPLIEDYTDAGFDARPTRDGAIFVVPGGVMKLGEKPEFVPGSDDLGN